MTKTRKQYSKEFKLDAISLVLEQGFTRKEAAEASKSMLRCWDGGSGNPKMKMDRLFGAMGD